GVRRSNTRKRMRCREGHTARILLGWSVVLLLAAWHKGKNRVHAVTSRHPQLSYPRVPVRSREFAGWKRFFLRPYFFPDTVRASYRRLLLTGYQTRIHHGTWLPGSVVVDAERAGPRSRVLARGSGFGRVCSSNGVGLPGWRSRAL